MTDIKLVDEDEIAPRAKRQTKYNSNICDRCNRPFEEAGHGTHYKEKIEDRWT